MVGCVMLRIQAGSASFKAKTGMNRACDYVPVLAVQRGCIASASARHTSRVEVMCCVFLLLQAVACLMRVPLSLLHQNMQPS